MTPPPARGHRLSLTLWTDDPSLAARADAAGVDRIGVDLERLGKAARQVGMRSWISDHQEDALAVIAPALRTADLFARCDPPHAGTQDQIARLLDAGVRVLMLPMYRTAAEVEEFADAVNGRARVVLLFETREAAALAATREAPPGVDEVHVGLNDLARAHGLRSRFALLAAPLLDRVAEHVHAAGLPLGIGGIARPGDTSLTVDPDLVYARLAALGTTSTLLSRVFVEQRGAQDSGADLARDVRDARARHALWRAQGVPARSRALDELVRQADGLIEW